MGHAFTIQERGAARHAVEVHKGERCRNSYQARPGVHIGSSLQHSPDAARGDARRWAHTCRTAQSLERRHSIGAAPKACLLSRHTDCCPWYGLKAHLGQGDRRCAQARSCAVCAWLGRGSGALTLSQTSWQQSGTAGQRASLCPHLTATYTFASTRCDTLMPIVLSWRSAMASLGPYYQVPKVLLT